MKTSQDETTEKSLYDDDILKCNEADKVKSAFNTNASCANNPSRPGGACETNKRVSEGSYTCNYFKASQKKIRN